MKKNLLTLLLLSFVALSSAFAQSRKITGRVTSADDGQPLPGVSVKIQGTSIGTQTDGSGNYSIEMSGNAGSLVFSYLGFETTTISATGKTVVSVALKLLANQLQEVVVSSGFGISQSKKDVTGSTASISGKQIEDLPLQSVDRAIQGRIPGVQVASTSGIPGAAIDVRVRGVGSLSTNAGANSPLYVIDNVQVTQGDNTRFTTSSNALAALNPDDIESITVLKDASAAAIYGASAANGVVVITTKRGKNGATQFNLSGYAGYNENIKNIDLLTGPQFVQLGLEAYANRYGTTSSQYTTFYNTYVAPFGSVDNVPTYDWFKAVSQKGRTLNYEGNARGGNDKTQFYLGGNYNKQDGQVIGTDYSRGSFKINVDHQASKKLELSTSINLATVNQRTTSGAGAFANISRISQLQAPNNAIYNADGTYNTNLPGGYDGYNTLQLAEFNKNTNITKQLTGSLSGKYFILPSLTLRTSFGLDYYLGNENNYLDPRFGDGLASNGDVTAAENQIINWQNDEVLTFTKTFNKDHNLTALVGFNYRNVVTTTLTEESQNFPLYLYTQISSGSVPFLTAQTYTNYINAGYFAKLDYNYKQKFYVSGTVRYDGSSKFGADNRFGWFPAGAVSYRISQEPFLKKYSFINDLKIRASYGITGNQGSIGNFDSKSLYVKAGDYVNGNLATGLNNTLGNSTLKWEKSATTDIAIEFSLFNSRLDGSIGVYRRITQDQLTAAALPLTSGFSSITLNAGEVSNEGYEVQLNSINFTSHNGFKWTTDFNIAFNRNKLVSLPNNQTILAGDYTYTVGLPIGQFYTYRSAGVNPADGRAMYYDGNGNITYTLNSATDRTYIGDRNPRWTGGLGNTISFKGFSLTGFFQFSYGNLALNSDRTFFERSGSTVDRNQYAYNLRRWTTPGQITDIPKPFYGGTVNNVSGISASSQYATTDRFYEDASYIRLKNVSLSYDLPKSLLNAAKLRSVKFYVQGVNLLTISKYRGVDPETLLTGDFGTYPQFKNYTVGVNVGF